MKKAKIVTALVLSTLFVASCEDSDSTDIRTNGIWAHAKVVSDENETKVSIELRVSGSSGNSIRLTNGEFIEANAFGETFTLTRDSDFFGVNSYITEFDLNHGGEEYTIDYYRDDNTVLSFSVDSPSPFSITGPTSRDQFSASETVDMTWTGWETNGLLSLGATYECYPQVLESGIVGIGRIVGSTIADSGTYKIASLESSLDLEGLVELEDNFDGCIVTVDLQRIQEGTFDSSIQRDSIVEAKQVRRTTYNVIF